MVFHYTGIGRRSVLEGSKPEKQKYTGTFTNRTGEQKGRVLRQAPIFSQCYTGTSCSGSIVTAASARECCVDTENGLSYSSNAECTPCIGEVLLIHNVFEPLKDSFQFMGLQDQILM